MSNRGDPTAETKEFDELDRRIIEQLSISSEGSFRQIAKGLGVHPTTLIQRVKNLERKGVINGTRAKIDYVKLGFEYSGIVQIFVEGSVDAINDRISDMPQVMAVFYVTGDCDIVVWISCRDRDEFAATVKAIMAIDGVKKTNTSVVMEMVKDPLDYVPEIV